MTISTETVPELIAGALERGQATLSEYDSKRIVAAYGIPVVREELVPVGGDVAAAAAQLGYPVVIKACSPALTHKTERGLVWLNVDGASSVAAAHGAIDEAAAGMALDGYLVQPMLRGKREVIVGGVRDALFGPCVMVGLGGILVEALADIAFRLAPLEPRDALEMVYELRGQQIFDTVRGEPAVDRDALAAILVAMGRIFVENTPISQIDINPLIFEGERPVAVDALVALET